MPIRFLRNSTQKNSRPTWDNSQAFNIEMIIRTITCNTIAIRMYSPQDREMAQPFMSLSIVRYIKKTAKLENSDAPRRFNGGTHDLRRKRGGLSTRVAASGGGGPTASPGPR